MGTIFTLDAAIKQTITAALDDLISELGKDCKLVYPPKVTRCPNCVYDPVNKKSTNRYVAGGPNPFHNIACPMCAGTGSLSEEQSESVKFLCALNQKEFFIPIPELEIRAPYSVIQTKGYINPHLPKVKRASHLIFQTSLAGVIDNKYKLLSSPKDVSNIIQDRYFVATWEEIK